MEQVFQLGTNKKSQIISSLKYSGLEVTEESTWDEIISAFQSYFPQEYLLYYNGNTYSSLTGGYGTSGKYLSWSTNNDGKLYFHSAYQASNTSGDYGYLFTLNPLKIEAEHTKLKCNVTSASQYYGQVYFYIGTGQTTRTKQVLIASYTTGTVSYTTSGEFTIDISNLEGDYYVGFMLASGGETAEHGTVYADKIWIE